ncbi:MAG: FliH/SctL family protein [Chloroflexota bacterium]
MKKAIFATFAKPAPVEPVVEPAPPDPAVVLERARARGEEAGYADGYARGRADGERALREQAARLSQLLDQATHDLREALFELEPQVIELAMAVAGRVVERELAADPTLVVGVVRAALEAAATLPVIRVRVHPTDEPTLAAIWASLGPTSGGTPVELVADPALQPGGCVVDTASGFVDAQPRTRLDELRMQVLPITEAPR